MNGTSQASEAQLRFVTDHMPILIAHCDQHCRYQFVNLPLAQLLDLQPADLIGRHVRELMGEALFAVAEPHIAATLRGQRVEFEMETLDKSGNVRTLHVIHVPEFDAQGQVVGFLAALTDISARKRIEDQLLISNQNLQATLDASPDLVFDMGLDGRYYDYHSPRLDLLAAPPDQVLGRLVTDVLPEEAANTVLEALREADQYQTSNGRQLQLTLPGGRRWFELSVARKSTPANSPSRFVVLSRDISARKLRETVDGFLAQVGVDADGLPFFQALARFLATTLQMNYICIDRLDGDGLTATTVAVWHDGEFVENQQYSLADTPCGEVPGRVTCCYPAAVTAYFPRDEALKALRAECYVGVPLRSHSGVPIGLIAVIGRHPLINPTQAEALLLQIAPRAAAEMERLAAETALRESEARFRSMFAQAPLGVALIDSGSGTILEANARLATIVGRSIAELTGLPWMRLAQPDRIQHGIDLLRQMRARGEAVVEFDNRHQRPDGSHVWIHVTIALVPSSIAGDSYRLCMVQDISERKQAEETMRSSHAVLSRFNALAVGRELRMVELKREINALCAELGRPPRHRVDAAPDSAEDSS